ncbi:MAG: hypothetical protein U1E70_00130 [Acetobacteraceae bacterium]
MAAPAPPGSEDVLRTLRRQIIEADDEQVRRVVATVDALASRGSIDRLLGPLRPRLEDLRPPRRLHFARLLFLPLDPLIVAPSRWRRDDPTLPRALIPPVTRLVEAGLPDGGAAVRQTIRGHTTADTEAISSAGAGLWQAASDTLAKATLPPRWADTGLAARHFAPLMHQIATLLAQAPAIDRVVFETANGLLPPDRFAIEAMARTVTMTCPDALPMLTIMLLRRLPQSAGLLYKLASNRSMIGLKAAAEGAADLLLHRLEASRSVVAHQDLPVFSAAVRQMAAFLAEIDHAATSRSRREQVRELRQRLDQDCQTVFTSGLTRDFLPPLQAPAAPVERLEEVARSLRVLEAEARTLGNAAVYQDQLTEAVAALETPPPHGGLALHDRVRLLELLAGPERALALLEREGDPLTPEL